MKIQMFLGMVALAATGTACSKSADVTEQNDTSAAIINENQTGVVKMSDSSLQQCEIKSAKINLINEDLLTRTAVTLESADTVAKPVVITAGDPRLAKLNEIIHGIELDAAVLPQLEMRMVLKLDCTDGATRIVTASKTEQGGLLHLNIDGKMASTTTPLRRSLDALLGGAR